MIAIDTQICSELDLIYQEMERKNDHLVSRKTGLVVDEIHWATIFISRYTTMEGRGYQILPYFLKSKHAIVNVKNRENRCIAYAVLSKLHPQKKNAERAWYYRPYLSDHGLDQISYPVTIE